MNKKITCIECPKGCILEVEMAGTTIREIRGNDCPKGIAYAKAEIQHPVRVLTSSVKTRGLSLKMIPVRTDRPIPKDMFFAGMQEIKKMVLDKEVKAGDVIAENFAGLTAALIVTRAAHKV